MKRIFGGKKYWWKKNAGERQLLIKLFLCEPVIFGKKSFLAKTFFGEILFW